MDIMKILVVEDPEKSRGILSAYLQKLGHTIETACKSQQVIYLFKKEKPDLVISDLEIQHLMDLDYAQKLRELCQENRVPLIFLNHSEEEEPTLQLTTSDVDSLATLRTETPLADKISAMQEITDMQKELYEATRKLRLLSSTDMLTGLENRLRFDSVIKEKVAYANRYNTQLALILINIDGFKAINDHLGHHIGDLLLQSVAKRLKMSLRKKDFIARLGSDEFGLILNQITHSGDAGYLAQKILTIISDPFRLAEHEIQVSCRIGIACYPASGTTADALVRHAGMALLYAKKSGRNNFQYYAEEFESNDQELFYLENALRSALKKHEIVMYYQPIFQLYPKKLVGMEALMRWKSPIFGDVLPDVFIPIAEERGLIKSLSEWALNAVCEQAANWYQEGYTSFKLSFNISSREFPSLDFITTLKKTLKKTKLPPPLLDLEITESSIMKVSAVNNQVMKDIADMQIGLSLDDFGTGYSSFTHLKNLPLSTLKIDRSFVMDLDKNTNDALILNAILSLGKILNLNLIAEGIENQEQLDFLINLGCPQGQGFYLSKPLTVEEMSLFLKTHAPKTAI